MLTVYDFTVGAVRGLSAKQVQMFLIHPSCIITPETYDFAQLDPPSAGSQGKYEYFEESFEDVFLLPNKQFGADFLVAGLTADTATFTSAAGTQSGNTVITMTAPVGNALKAKSRYFYATGCQHRSRSPRLRRERCAEHRLDRVGWRERDHRYQRPQDDDARHRCGWSCVCRWQRHCRFCRMIRRTQNDES